MRVAILVLGIIGSVMALAFGACAGACAGALGSEGLGAVMQKLQSKLPKSPERK